MNLFIHGKYQGRQAFDAEIKVLFGLRPEDKWPAQGMDPRQIQGITCWVNPLPPDSGRRRNFAIRARATCPACHKVMPIGRLQQHSKVHK